MDLLRAKKVGVQNDFTGSLASTDVFMLDEVARYGLKSTISTLSYDPVQSLLAVGTHEVGSISGCVHVFGVGRVHHEFPLPRKASVKFVRLCDSKLVVLDSKNWLTVYDLEDLAARPVEYSPPGVVTVVETDACLDWCFLGLQNGDVVVYDIDREVLAPFRIPNFWRERSPKARVLPVVSLALHPKDVGTLLIGYLEGAAIYSFKQNAVGHFLAFEIPPGAPGADTELAQIRTVRRPRLSQALWHPTGTFVCTAYEDSVMAFWNPKDGSLVQARTLQDAYVHLPGDVPGRSMFNDSGGISIRQPIFKAAWCSTANPDDTALLIAGGNSMTMPAKGMTLLDFGPTPNMLTSSAQVVAEHLASPRRQRVLPTPADLDVIDFCIIPKEVAHYGGGHNPVAVIGLQVSGELVTLRFPDGAPLSPAGLLHPSLILSHPFTSRMEISSVERTRWLGMEEKRQRGPEILAGGIEHKKPLKRYLTRKVVQTLHPNGTVRIWDLGCIDEVENESVFELDVGRVLQRGVDLKVDHVSMTGATAETAVALETGEVVVYTWGVNKGFGRTREDEELMSSSRTAGEIAEGVIDVKSRADPDIRESLLPVCLLRQNCGAVVAMKMSDVGFVAVAYQTGHLCVLDMRGPAVIFHHQLSALTVTESKRSSFRKSKERGTSAGEKATCLEFGVLTLEGDEFSSIVLFVGTSTGRVLTFKVLPASGGFTCVLAGTSTLDNPLVSVVPLNSETGQRAWASGHAVSSLREGRKTPGVLVAVTRTSIHLFKAPSARGAHKSLPESMSCNAAMVTELEDYGCCLTAILAPSGIAQSYTIPGLKHITDADLSVAHLHDPRILESGHILGLSGEHELTLLHIFGKGSKIEDLPHDVLYNPDLPPPPRPTISNLQWLAGTQFISTADLDLLIGGPDRPMSRKQQQQLSIERQEARQQQKQPAEEEQGGGGMFAGMTKALQERTQALSFATDSMDNLANHSQNLADEMGKFVKQQKRKALLGGVMGKFF